MSDSRFNISVMILWMVHFLVRLNLSRVVSGATFIIAVQILDFPVWLMGPNFIPTALMGYIFLSILSLAWSYASCALWRHFRNR